MKASGISISRYLIYQYIAQDKEDGGHLYKYLRNHGKKRKAIGDGTKTKIPDRVGIEHRPQIAAECVEYGHFEGDTIVSKDHNGITVTLTEKKTMQQFIIPIKEMKAVSVANAIITVLKNHPLPVKTLTFDNGWEFTEHKRITKELGCDVYFARPYCSTDKALVENHNRLIRDFIPKGTDFKTIPDEYWSWIQDVLNNRSREKFGFKSPNYMVAQELASWCD